MTDSKFQDFINVLSLQSTVYSEYFNSLMRNHNIKTIRHGMTILIFYFYCEVISSHITQRGILFRPIVALCMFCAFLLIFVLTINVSNTSVMVKLASIMVVMCTGYTVLLATDNMEVIETHYSLSILIILMMYTLFQLRFLISMLLSVINIIIFLAVGNHRFEYLKLMNQNSTLQPSLREVRKTDYILNEKGKFILCQGILFLMIYLTGIYLRTVNSIRRKCAFLKCAQNAESKLKMNSAIQVQLYWIEAIMPTAVKEEFLKERGNKDSTQLVYCKKFENVSILFGDIVGFTAMSSNKTAAQLVFLLNDLYNRFDEYATITKCEKIGTLGDCYYCVSGCPLPRPDHASCCVEMGLGMCRLIQRFNKDHSENVNMRVGIHSGRVIAVIIGNHRFRFDVFSNDVIVANSLESSGEPGQVHISEDTYKLTRHAYIFRDGDTLEIKKEESFGLSGMVQKTVMIRTFFVIPNTNKPFIRSNSKMTNKNINASNRKDRSVRQEFGKLFNERVSATKKDAKMKEDLNLVRAMRCDPEHPVEFFKNPPINPFILTFKDREIEAHFLNHTMDQIRRLHIDSVKIAPLLDAIYCIIYSSILLFTASILIPKASGFQYQTPIIFASAILVSLIITWTSLTFKSEVPSTQLQIIFHCLNHPISRLVFNIYVSSVPCLLVYSLVKREELFDNQFTNGYFTLTLFALIGHCIFTGSFSTIKYISTFVFALLTSLALKESYLKDKTKKIFFSSCSQFLINHMKIQIEKHEFGYLFQIVQISLLIYYLTRENEKNIRIHFYASREAQIRTDEAKREKRLAEDLLYNIIPKYVFAQIVSNKSSSQKNMRFSYAHAIPTAGVLFACISNFFSSYYREDYKSGESALKLLHTIICSFDNILTKPYFNQVEKIKTINDCYMVASGLNVDSVSFSGESHLITLLKFAFDIQASIKLFNEKNIIGSEAFKLKIGYNYGPVTAGIIGNTKPLYDIWGDTVNVASRMYSTAPSGTIQVPDYVEKEMNRYFEFEMRGTISIKGKGEMLTYLGKKCYDNPNIDRLFKTSLF